MLGSEVLNELRLNLLDAIKEGKVLLLFHYKDGTPLHAAIRRKIAGMEKMVQGVEIINAGGTAYDVCAAIDEVIAAIEDVINLSHCQNCAEPVYAERAAFMGMRAKFLKLEEMMTVGEVPMKDEGDVVLN